MTYVTRDREAGNVIDEFDTLKEAEEAIRKYEEEDKTDGTYTPNFYEIAEDETRYEKALRERDEWLNNWMATLHNLRDELRKQSDLFYGFGEYEQFEELDMAVFHMSNVIAHLENVKGDE